MSPEKPSLPARVVMLAVRFYRAAISPWLGPNCRHYPTCSAYMLEAVREWGALKGVWLGLKRLSGCHPWGTSGYDPVPRKPGAERKKRPGNERITEGDKTQENGPLPGDREKLKE